MLMCFIVSSTRWREEGELLTRDFCDWARVFGLHAHDETAHQGGQKNYGEIVCLKSGAVNYRDWQVAHIFTFFFPFRDVGCRGCILSAPPVTAALLKLRAPDFKTLNRFRRCVVTRTSFSLANSLLTMMAAAVVLFAATASAQTFSLVQSFNGTDGAAPEDTLTQGLDGNFYASATDGGTQFLPNGTAFKMSPSGTITTLYSFCDNNSCSDGCNPSAGLLQATNNGVYGTTRGCGLFGGGTIYRVASSGGMTTIYNFCALSNCADGDFPNILIQASDGNIYATTLLGGIHSAPSQGGTVFKMSLQGALTTLYSFCAQTNCTDGSQPGAMVQATDGNFYGVTAIGGALGEGSFFKITPSGGFTSLYGFCAVGNCADGRIPGALIQATDGNFYGTTSIGGNLNCKEVGCGVIFKITPAGVLTTLYTFCNTTGCPDGSGPGGLIQGTDGNFYGTTNAGGSHKVGTIFAMTPAGVLTTLHSFVGPDGQNPVGLVQATSGSFYGTAMFGGAFGDGTVFRLGVGLPAFVKTLPTMGRVGATVLILGNNLSGTTSVTFNGTAASFTVISPSALRTTVPAGATTGSVQVTTPTGTLTSNVVFGVN
jgi:uncharacterized repeat protein (TIGR03803 family)